MHDLFDFYRAGLIDVGRAIERGDQKITTLVEGHSLAWSAEQGWAVEGTLTVEYAMRFMQGLTKRYVIDSDTLAATQIGHRRVVKRLFRMYLLALGRDEVRVFPEFFRDDARVVSASLVNAIEKPSDFVQLRDSFETVAEEIVQRAGRLAADVVASLTDRQALALSARSSGMSPQDGFAGQRDA